MSLETKPTLWTVAALSRELGRSRKGLAKALADVRPDGRLGVHKAWRLQTVLQALSEHDATFDNDWPVARRETTADQNAKLALQAFADLERTLQVLRDEPDVEARRALATTHRVPLGQVLRALTQLDDGDGDVIGKIVRDVVARQVFAEVFDLLQWQLPESESEEEPLADAMSPPRHPSMR